MTDEEKLQDSAYLAGAKAGWNAAQADDPNGAYARLVASRDGYLTPLVATQPSPVEAADALTRMAGELREAEASAIKWQDEALRALGRLDRNERAARLPEAEIALLEAEVERLRATGKGDLADYAAELEDQLDAAKEQVEALRRERDKLRAALQRCCEELEQWHDAKHVLAIARTALETKP